MEEKMENYLNNKDYLPGFMKVQNEQDLLFKRLQVIVNNRVKKDSFGSYLEELTRENGQEYIVNIFLRYMAEHGYTLQKSRKRVRFCNLKDELIRFERNETIHTEMDVNLKTYLAEGNYLPNPLDDFHECKVVFRLIKTFTQSPLLKEVGWSTAHVYTVDVFLWFLAKHGYTLQVNRKKLEFKSIDSEVYEFERKRRDEMTKLIFSEINKKGN